MIKKYGVLDENGVKINTILVDDQFAQTFYPGYGAALIDEGVAPVEPKAPPPPPQPVDFKVYDFSLAQPMLVGDTIDLKTGVVTPRVEAVVEATELI